MGFDVVDVPGLSNEGHQYSNVVKKGNFVFITGQSVLHDSEAKTLDARDQAIRIFKNLERCMESAGGSLQDIVKLNIFLTGAEQFSVIKEVRPQFFKSPYPATTTMVVHSIVLRDLMMAIDAIAILDD